MVRMSHSIWVGWNSSVRPFHTGTPAYCAQDFHQLLAEAAVLDAVVHAAQHPGGVLHRLLVADLRAGRSQVGDVGALVVGGHLEGAAGAGGGLLEDQGDVLALQPLLLVAAVLGRFQVGRQLEQELELLGGEVQLLQKLRLRKLNAILNFSLVLIRNRGFF